MSQGSGHWKAVGAAAILAGVVVVVPQGRLAADGPGEVYVTNFPERQQIEGRVAISSPVPSTRFFRLPALVSPAGLAEVNSLTEGGVLDTTGFPTVTLGLSGAVQATTPQGELGVVLIPDQPEILAAFHEHGRLHLAIKLEAAADPATALFASEPITVHVLFPRYRVFFYNGTSHTARATLFATLAT